MRQIELPLAYVGSLMLAAGLGWFALSRVDQIAHVIAWSLVMVGAGAKLFTFRTRSS